MSIIGTFTVTHEGGWSGTIHTLTLNTKVRFIPNDTHGNDAMPAFKIFAGRSEIGAAWRRQSSGENPRTFLSVRLDDPCLSEPLQAALFESMDGKEAQLVWRKRG
jgi:uncharacterized protein (DUF736 family)